MKELPQEELPQEEMKELPQEELPQEELPDEIKKLAPRRLCSCCEHFKVLKITDLCSWCIDCPTGYCDIPRKYMKGNYD